MAQPPTLNDLPTDIITCVLEKLQLEDSIDQLAFDQGVAAISEVSKQEFTNDKIELRKEFYKVMLAQIRKQVQQNQYIFPWNEEQSKNSAKRDDEMTESYGFEIDLKTELGYKAALGKLVPFIDNFESLKFNIGIGLSTGATAPYFYVNSVMVTLVGKAGTVSASFKFDTQNPKPYPPKELSGDLSIHTPDLGARGVIKEILYYHVLWTAINIRKIHNTQHACVQTQYTTHNNLINDELTTWYINALTESYHKLNIDEMKEEARLSRMNAGDAKRKTVPRPNPLKRATKPKHI